MEKEVFLRNLGKRIRKLRMVRGMTQGELAEKCGYTSATKNSTINKIEAGRSDVSASRLMTIAEALGVSISFLMGETDPASDEKFFAQTNAIRLMRKKLSEEEQKELIKGLQFFFIEENAAEEN